MDLSLRLAFLHMSMEILQLGVLETTVAGVELTILWFPTSSLLDVSDKVPNLWFKL